MVRDERNPYAEQQANALSTRKPRAVTSGKTARQKATCDSPRAQQASKQRAATSKPERQNTTSGSHGTTPPSAQEATLVNVSM